MHVSPNASTDTLVSEFHDLKRHDVWFDDGNLILQTDDALFRIYSGLLSARSSVFKDMLAFPSPPEGNPTHDNCPVVRIYDSTEDVGYFLNAIFDSGFFEAPPAPTELQIVSGVLRLSTKYDVQYLRKRALQHLAATFPSTLEAWHERDKTLAREFDIPWIVPSIMYCISSHPLAKSVEGAEFCGTNLVMNPKDRLDALLGREKLLMLQNRYSVYLSQQVPPEPGSEGGAGDVLKCTGEKCASTRQKIPEIVTGWTVACYLDFYREHQMFIDNGFCKGCLAAFLNKHQELAEEMWSALPFIFGLEDWQDLDRLREKAVFIFNLATVFAKESDEPNSQEIQFELPSQISVNQTFPLRFYNTHHKSDWDIRLLQNDEDVGTYFRHVDAEEQVNFTIDVTLNYTGNHACIRENFTFLAKIREQHVGKSDTFSISPSEEASPSSIQVSAPVPTDSDTASSTGSFPSVTIAGAAPVSETAASSEGDGSASNPSTKLPDNMAAARSSGPNKPLIIGLTISLSTLLLVCILVFMFIRRRRRRNHIPNEVVFNREMMFERRPSRASRYDTWTMRSMDLEKGSISLTNGEPLKVYVSRSVLSDRSSMDS
ncbi:hypothetical protein NP233_g8071 [Leucocoprinus birnbaumii]|uniref:BTB domain-containing protein n=1 Tax=Leucocoprinus birnbaumii TaxID=56174 RepID=A0AAD5VPL7_9AGAR|nr:hypothetical protein NP233_g8071 [Leucocoprinus birnbaumii]